MKKKKEEPEGGRFSVIDLVRGFMEYATDQGNKKWFPPLGEEIWQTLLLRTVQKLEGQGMPEAASCFGRFEWDDSYPKISGWDNTRAALTLICEIRRDSKVSLMEGLSRMERRRLLQQVIEMMFSIANEINFFRE